MGPDQMVLILPRWSYWCGLNLDLLCMYR